MKIKNNRIIFNGHSLSSPIRIVALANQRSIRINGRRYHDNILIRIKNGRLNVINELGIEDYIKGILPKEVSPKWPIESLKAQAIVSRTYALRNLKKHGSQGFDLCNTVHCQVYGGIESEQLRTNKAVEFTRGQVLTYNKKLAQALFHASCGGRTEVPNNVWNVNSRVPKYLEGVRDGFCKESPHHKWTKKISEVYLRGKLKKAGYNIGKISSIKILGRNKTGRATYLLIKNSYGKLKILAAKFRLAIDPWKVKSTMFSRIRKIGSDFEFSGRGWGHGVGMCQWGAKAMSDRRYKYKKILRYYFPGTRIERWDD